MSWKSYKLKIIGGLITVVIAVIVAFVDSNGKPLVSIVINYFGESEEPEKEPVSGEDSMLWNVVHNCSTYGRWTDYNEDGQNTRQEVLIEESIGPVQFKTKMGREVEKGMWRDPYTGKIFTDPRKLKIDHLVGLTEVDQSGGLFWDEHERRAYANYLDDPYHLLAVEGHIPQLKSGKDPLEWLPSNATFDYLRAWADIKNRWELTADPGEIAALRAWLGPDAKLPEEALEIHCGR